jgi:hypothetical protein
MEITWHGLRAFASAKGLATVVTDPYNHAALGFEALKLRAEIVTISHDAPGHNNAAAVKGRMLVITGPGEYG